MCKRLDDQARLGIALEDVGDKDRAAKCKEITRLLYGIVSGLGYEANQISDILEKFRKNVNGWTD
jgi:hypothetical protein